jgi:hypothetical protein
MDSCLSGFSGHVVVDRGGDWGSIVASGCGSYGAACECTATSHRYVPYADTGLDGRAELQLQERSWTASAAPRDND